MMREYLKEALLQEASQTAIMRAGLKMGGSFGLWNHEVMTGEHQLPVLKGFVDGLRKVGYDDFAIAMYGDWTDGRHMGDSFEGIISDWERTGQKKPLDKLIAAKVEKDARPVNEVRKDAKNYIDDLNISTKVEFRDELQKHYGVKESFRERLTKLSEVSTPKSRFKEAKWNPPQDPKDGDKYTWNGDVYEWDGYIWAELPGTSYVGPAQMKKEDLMPHIKEPGEPKFPRGAYSKAINLGTSYGQAVEEIGNDLKGMMDEWVEDEPTDPADMKRRIDKAMNLSRKLDSSITDKRLKFHAAMNDLLSASTQSMKDADKKGGK